MNINWPILSVVTFLPLLGAAFIMLVRGNEALARGTARWVAMWTTLVTFAISLVMVWRFDATSAEFQFVEKSAKYSTAEELKKTYDADPNRNLVDLALQIEVVSAKFGPEAGRRVFASGDPQIQKALTEFGEASRIASLPKKKREVAVKAGK